MKTVVPIFAASDAKNNFGKLIDAAQRRPVAIERRGRTVAFVLAPEDMEAMEDLLLGMKARASMKKGSFLGAKKTRALFAEIRGHARD